MVIINYEQFGFLDPAAPKSDIIEQVSTPLRPTGFSFKTMSHKPLSAVHNEKLVRVIPS